MKELQLHPSIGPLDKKSDDGGHLYLWRTGITCDVADLQHWSDKKKENAIKVSTPWMVALN